MGRVGVMLLAEDPLMGGVASYVLSIAEALKGDNRFRLYIGAFPAWEGEPHLANRAKRAGLKMEVFPMSGTFDIRVLARLRKYCDEHRIHVIHTQGYRSTVIASLAGTKRTLINTCHGKLVGASRRLERWEKAGLWAMARHRRTIAVSDHVRAWLLTQGFLESSVMTVRNCTPPPCASGKDLRTAMDADGKRLVLLYAGRLVEGKGLDWMCDAVKEISDATLIVAGEGPLKAELKEKARLGGIDARFLGAIEDVTPYYEAADIVLLPSQMEALPMTLIEAASFGKPVIATHAGGIPEVVRDGSTGLLVQYGDVAALRQAIDYLSDERRRKTMGEAAHRHWQEAFSLPRLAEAMSALYLEVGKAQQ